ncbi:MAG: DUF481 domain-containing protein [Myxococcota bacterium]
MRCKLLAGGVVMACGLPASAMASPVNTERMASAVDTEGWSATLDAKGGYRDGNVDKINASFSGGLQYETFHPSAEGAPNFLRDRWLLATNVVFVNFNGNDVTDSGFMHTRYTRMVRPRIGAETFLQAQYNAFTRLRSRMLYGLGARVDAVHRPAFRLWGGSGYMLEYEINATADGDPHPAETFNHRWTSYVTAEGSLVDGQLRLRNTAYVQPRLDDFGDLRLLDSAQIEAAVGKVFALGIDFELQFDSRPPAGIARRDVQLGSYLRLRFG